MKLSSKIVEIGTDSRCGATKIFRVVGKLLLYRKKSMGKMDGNFINRQKFLGSTKD